MVNQLERMWYLLISSSIARMVSLEGGTQVHITRKHECQLEIYLWFPVRLIKLEKSAPCINKLGVRRVHA